MPRLAIRQWNASPLPHPRLALLIANANYLDANAPPRHAGNARWSARNAGEFRSAGLELAGEGVGAAPEKPDVGAHGDKRVAPADIAPRLLLAQRENAGRLADGLEAVHGLLQRRLHLRVLRVSDMPERGRKVRGTDEHAVDAVDRRDGFERVEPRSRLHLDKQADLAVRPLEVVGHAAIAARA